ncbi:hypothetical protein [Nostoc sp. DedSLP04]|uniref:hypothetical protein n=1 Tax=Nostoc sp. DedSLP04 TaxID=3075401 RepID=UPI002AD37510|nr:hypothetical protein [Nostoc sp. DedSLP04]MDZ8030013.1 hypothetical protein [Nostoc sp. DedSLP04]
MKTTLKIESFLRLNRHLYIEIDYTGTFRTIIIVRCHTKPDHHEQFLHGPEHLRRPVLL